MAPRPTPEKRALAVADYVAGMRVYDLLAKHHVKGNTLLAWVRAAGVPVRGLGRPKGPPRGKSALQQLRSSRAR